MTESLPSAIRDAIRITELLGEQYLWIDSLCLDQSDLSALKIGIGFMDRIYADSVLTLVLATAKNVHSEIPGLRPFSRLKSASEVCVDGQLIKATCAAFVGTEFAGPW
jgi:Heterokaryon incompatibility protein (HET)